MRVEEATKQHHKKPHKRVRKGHGGQTGSRNWMTPSCSRRNLTAPPPQTPNGFAPEPLRGFDDTPSGKLSSLWLKISERFSRASVNTSIATECQQPAPKRMPPQLSAVLLSKVRSVLLSAHAQRLLNARRCLESGALAPGLEAGDHWAQ